MALGQKVRRYSHSLAEKVQDCKRQTGARDRQQVVSTCIALPVMIWVHCDHMILYQLMVVRQQSGSSD